MLGDGPLAWLAGAGARRNLLLLVAGYLAVSGLTLLIVVGMIAALPVTYFRDGDQPVLARGGPAAVVGRILRNALGLVLIALGLFLSLPAVPGQGVLTMLIGLMLVDFPGKRRFELKLVARPGTLATMNRVRGWLGRPPLVL